MARLPTAWRQPTTSRAASALLFARSATGLPTTGLTSFCAGRPSALIAGRRTLPVKKEIGSEHEAEPTSTATTSNGSKARSAGSRHPAMRSFGGRMSMGLSIFFGWLALKLAPWLYRPKTPPTTDTPHKGD